MNKINNIKHRTLKINHSVDAAVFNLSTVRKIISICSLLIQIKFLIDFQPRNRQIAYSTIIMKI